MRKRKDGRYETRATLDTPTGRKRVSFYGDTAEEANNKKIQALADQARGVLFTDPGRLTVGDYLQSWLSDTARYQVSESTLSRYERACRVHLVPFFGHLRLRELSAAHIRAFKAHKIEEGLNPNTVGLMQGVLSGALNQAVHDGLIASNPASRVKKAATRGQRPMRSLSLDEASRLTAAAEGTRDETLIVVALRTGIRQGELAALRWEDVDLGTVGSRRSPSGTRPTPGGSRGSRRPRQARSAASASGPAPSRSSGPTTPASAKSAWPRRPGPTPASSSRTPAARSAGATTSWSRTGAC